MLALLALLTARVEAQECRGIPARYAHAVADRRELSDGTVQYGGEAGVAIQGKLGLYGNYSRADIGLAGSRTLSYGGGAYRQMRGGLLAACFLAGYQMGKSYLINAAGTNENLRITQGRASLGAAASVGFTPLRGMRLTLFAVPSLLLGKRTLLAYDRSDTTSIAEQPSAVAYVGGASFIVSRVLARVAWVKAGDSEALIVLSGGIAW
ncbi:MAG: hypothetical protein KA761_02150 [Gemmatimonadaceae bacterium]|nr:hypothetical protein [Gemmatimonadaceae bacterium]